MNFDIPYLVFKEIQIHDYHKFIKNRKYILVDKDTNLTTVQIVIYREYKTDYNNYITFNIDKEIQRYNQNQRPGCIYYELDSKKQQRQNAMEQRALNLILRNITGDANFEISLLHGSV